MADDLKYGYKGAEPTQSFGNNTGVFDPNDINNLIADNKWTTFGQLELIETQTITTTTSLMDFKESDGTFDTSYNVHFLTVNNFKPEIDGANLMIRFFESGVLETANVYQFAYQYGSGTGNFNESKSTSIGYLRATSGIGNFGNESGHSYIYLYNLSDNAKYSFQTFHTTYINQTPDNFYMFGSGVLPQTSTVDGIRLQPTGGDIDEVSVSLYGIRYS